MNANASTAPSESTNKKAETLSTILDAKGVTIQEFRDALAQGSASTPDETHVSRSADRIHTTDYTAHQLPAIRSLYAIIDGVTDQIVGGIQLHLNATSAIRTLSDIIANPETMIHKHPLDFDLWLLGSLTTDHRVRPEKMKIISGAQIQALVEGAKEQLESEQRR